MTTVEIVLKHLVPALEAARRDLEAQRLSQPPPTAPPQRVPELPRREAPTPSKRLLTVAQASDRLSMSKSYLYILTSQRRIPHHKIGSRLLFTEEQLEQWLTRQRIDAVRGDKI